MLGIAASDWSKNRIDMIMEFIIYQGSQTLNKSTNKLIYKYKLWCKKGNDVMNVKTRS